MFKLIKSIKFDGDTVIIKRKGDYTKMSLLKYLPYFHKQGRYIKHCHFKIAYVSQRYGTTLNFPNILFSFLALLFHLSIFPLRISPHAIQGH